MNTETNSLYRWSGTEWVEVVAIRELQAVAWDEGNAAGWNDGARANTAGLDKETQNPYREGSPS